MSHVATVDIEIRDLPALGEAAQRCGLELVRDQTSFQAHRLESGSAHLIRVPGNSAAYEIGVMPGAKPGTFTLAADSWRGGKGMEKFSGRDCGKLRQAYAIIVAAKEARRKGFLVQEHREQDGSIKLVLMKGGA